MEAVRGLETLNTPEARYLKREALYRVACSHAVQGRREDALGSLEQAVRGGFRGASSLDQLETDSELDDLRDDPRFEKVLRLARSVKG